MGIVVQMYLKDADAKTPVPLRAPLLGFTLVVCAIVTVALGVLPGFFVELAKSSILPTAWNLF
jgi:NADH:ubiquinone oxidoreductase subunit 2 (subunit N)